MSWQTIHFQGIVKMDQEISTLLSTYLEQKENRLVAHLIKQIHSLSWDPSQPILPLNQKRNFYFNDLIDIFDSKKNYPLIPPPKEELNKEEKKLLHIASPLNQALWEYTEVLEGAVNEMFQQIKEIPIGDWNPSLGKIILSTKETLSQHIESFISTVLLLENRLNYPPRNFARKLADWFHRKKKAVDPEIIVHLNQTQKYLDHHYQYFLNQFDQNSRLQLQTIESIEKLNSLPVYNRLKHADQELYQSIFQMIKLIDLSSSEQDLSLKNEYQRTLKQIGSIQDVTALFKRYLNDAKLALFNASLELKSHSPERLNYQDTITSIQKKTEQLCQEIDLFIYMVNNYREISFSKNSNSLIDPRWSLKENASSTQPDNTPPLTQLLYQGEEIKTWCEKFKESLAYIKKNEWKDFLSYNRELLERIENNLHYFSEPFISEKTSRIRGESLTESLQEADELGSPFYSMISFSREILDKALRSDWKYHVLYRLPEFQELYRIHNGLQTISNDSIHLARVKRFKQLFQQIEIWIKQGDMYSHINEIQTDMSDIKNNLQGYSGLIQQAIKDKNRDPFFDETYEKYQEQLLEYRYLFGQFFYRIKNQNSDGRQLRNQFLFVDQYFESFENMLQDMKLMI